MKSLITIPTYNEAGNIVPLIKAIHQHAPDLDILVIDDNSPDATADLAQNLERTHVLRRPAKLGLGAAIVAGLRYGLEHGYDAIGTMDADFSHDPAILPRLFAGLKNASVCLGARYIPGGGTRNWSLRRKILSRGANLAAKLMLNMPLHDVTTGYRAYRRDAIEGIDIDTIKSQGYAFQVEVLYRCINRGFHVIETPILFEDRRGGISKLNKNEIWGGIARLFILRFSPKNHP